MDRMTGKIRELRPKAVESEKITINLGFVDPGRIRRSKSKPDHSERRNANR